MPVCGSWDCVMAVWPIYVVVVASALGVGVWRFLMLNTSFDPWTPLMRLLHLHMHDWQQISTDGDEVSLVCRTCRKQMTVRTRTG